MAVNDMCVRVAEAARTSRMTAISCILRCTKRMNGSLRALPASLSSPADLIASGAADYRDVVRHSLAQFAAKYDFFTRSIGVLDSLFGAATSRRLPPAAAWLSGVLPAALLSEAQEGGEGITDSRLRSPFRCVRVGGSPSAERLLLPRVLDSCLVPVPPRRRRAVDLHDIRRGNQAPLALRQLLAVPQARGRGAAAALLRG